MRRSCRPSTLVVAFCLCLVAPLVLSAAGLPQSDESCPVAFGADGTSGANVPSGSGATVAAGSSLAAIFAGPDGTTPTKPSPAQISMIGVCASSCDPATCPKGPHGFCQRQNCNLGQFPSTCGTGDRCISIINCN